MHKLASTFASSAMRLLLMSRDIYLLSPLHSLHLQLYRTIPAILIILDVTWRNYENV